MATFWAVSVSLYLNRRWTRPISDACRAEDGRDWMLNSGVFRFDHRNAGARDPRGVRRAVRELPAVALAGLEARPAMSAPVFPRTGTRGHYESYYLRAVDPRRRAASGSATRCCRRPGGAPAGSLWCTVWDARAGPPVAVKSTPGLATAGDWLEIAGARFGPGAVSGARPPGRTRGVGPDGRRRRAAAAPPPPPAALPRPAAAHEAREPGPGRAALGHRRGGRPARSSSTAGPG